MENKKMLAILGSPKDNGNIFKMLNIAMEEAKENGYDVTFINPYEMNISYCKGCVACKKTGTCIIDDDIKIIRDALINCDLVVVAAPVYFANIPGCLKNVFDRLVASVMDDNSSVIPKPKLSPKQKYILMTTCNTPAPFDVFAGQSTGCIKAMKEVLNISGMKYGGKVIFAGTKGKKEIPIKITNKIKKYIKRA